MDDGHECVEHAYVLTDIELRLDGAWQAWECVRCGATTYGRPLGSETPERSDAD